MPSQNPQPKSSSTPPDPKRSHFEQDVRKIADDVKDAAETTLREEIAEKIAPQSKTTS